VVHCEDVDKVVCTDIEEAKLDKEERQGDSLSLLGVPLGVIMIPYPHRILKDEG
jgi:hypothetical protein